MRICDDAEVQRACRHCRVDLGWSVREIAEHSGVNENVVKEALRAAGVDPAVPAKLHQARRWAKEMLADAKLRREQEEI